jgi:hypothetical protein
MAQDSHSLFTIRYSKENNLRFTLIKDLKKDVTMKPILTGLLAFILLYVSADVVVKEQTIGLFYDEITLTLFGSAEEFLDPMSKASFLEFLHAEIFFLMMILLTLSAIFIRLRSQNKFSLLLLNITMSSALLTLVTLGLSYFVSASFINIYVVTFFLWHIGSIFMILLSLWSLSRE